MIIIVTIIRFQRTGSANSIRIRNAFELPWNGSLFPLGMINVIQYGYHRQSVLTSSSWSSLWFLGKQKHCLKMCSPPGTAEPPHRHLPQWRARHWQQRQAHLLARRQRVVALQSGGFLQHRRHHRHRLGKCTQNVFRKRVCRLQRNIAIVKFPEPLVHYYIPIFNFWTISKIYSPHEMVCSVLQILMFMLVVIWFLDLFDVGLCYHRGAPSPITKNTTQMATPPC